MGRGEAGGGVHARGEEEGWQGVERDMNEIVSSTVHSSMGPIRVEIARSEATSAALPSEGAE
jgi:hypothetical protein